MAKFFLNFVKDFIGLLLELGPIQFSLPRVKYNFGGEGRGLAPTCKIESSDFKLG